MWDISRFMHLLIESVKWKFNLIYIYVERIRTGTFIISIYPQTSQADVILRSLQLNVFLNEY